MLNEQEFIRKSEAQRDTAFKAFIDSQPIRLLMSMIPEGQHPEALRTILSEAHKQGWMAGQTSLALTIFEQSLKDSRR